MRFFPIPMLLGGMLSAVDCGVSFAAAHLGHGKKGDAYHSLELPQVARVDAQPLLLQCQRLAEALDSIGSSLSPDTAASLKKLTELQDDAEITGKVQALLDPQCIAALDIGEDGKLVASPALNGMELEDNGWRTALVKVINKAGVTSRLRMDSPSARPLPRAPADEVANRWMTLSVFDGRPLAAGLSGLGLEYRVIQLSAIGTGERKTNIEFSVGGLPGQKSSVIREWNFTKAADGWGNTNNGVIEAGGGSLRFKSDGSDPFMSAPVQARGGRMVLRFFAQSDMGGMGQLYWTSPDASSPDAQRQVAIQMHSGAPQIYEVEFETVGELAGLRLDPGMAPGNIRIDWMNLEYAKGESADLVL